jgi:integrase
MASSFAKASLLNANEGRPAAERAANSNTSHGTSSGIHSQRSLKRTVQMFKVVQESLRHASSKITLDVYTQASPSDVRNAQLRIADEITTCFAMVFYCSCCPGVSVLGG